MAENEIRIPCDLDKDSVEFLESELGAKINPHLETEKDYNRAIFYFKCCAMKKEAGNSALSEDTLSVGDCFSSKEKADVLFENVYAHALEYRELLQKLEKDPSVMEKFEQIYPSGSAAETATLNEHLAPNLHNEIIMQDGESKRDIGNAQLMQTASMAQFSGYLQAFPNLTEDMGAKYSAVMTMAAADIAAHLPEGANPQDYLPIIKEHPKAVLALAITAEANKAARVPFTLSSPEDLLTKCQHPAIVALSDKIEFNDLNGSKKEVYGKAQPVIGLGRESNDTPTISRAKVNEG